MVSNNLRTFLNSKFVFYGNSEPLVEIVREKPLPTLSGYILRFGHLRYLNDMRG